MNHVIYSTEKSLVLAKKIAHNLNCGHYTIERQKFADGEINVKFNESIRGKSLIIVAQIEMPYENLFELLLTLDAARRCSAREIILVIPYLPHSRQERRGDLRSPISARLLADLLQNAGANRIISMDLHVSAIEGFYSIPFDKLSPFDVFVNKIKSMNIENPCLVSPDFGFLKKMELYHRELNIPLHVIDKKREVANQVKEMTLIGDVKGKNVIMIDDIIDTASTLVKASDLLLDYGATSVSVFATHGVLSNNAEDRLYNSRISKVYITNTIYKGIPYDDGRISTIDVSTVFSKAIEKIQQE